MWLNFGNTIVAAAEFVRSNLKTILIIVGLLVAARFLFFRETERITVTNPSPSSPAASTPIARTLEIVTLLSPDAIPAIDKPRLYSAAEADKEYAPEERVLGVSIGGESRAYSTGLLSRHEIVNDVLGGRKIAVTW
jgi:hypothetical protein